MERHRMRDALLFVIALCLVLIVVRLYSSSDFVREAHAQSGGGAYLYGCTSATTTGGCKIGGRCWRMMPGTF